MPGTPGLYRLSEPHRDGARRTRQAVHDLRRHGYRVQADYALDPALPSDPPRPVISHELSERRSRIAQAAAAPSPQRAPVLSATHGLPSLPPSGRPITGPTPSARTGRGR
ncbi:hypothetical protein [Streptomyces sp. NPDC003077]|uniref:hypothetical protein n=1 Tax=Streptomyces sp. NPDC003077 TaxID=3154443 RepID=UPI0033B1FB67